MSTIDEWTGLWIEIKEAERAFAMAAKFARALLAATWRRCRAPIGREHRRLSYARSRESQSLLVLVPTVTP